MYRFRVIMPSMFVTVMAANDDEAKKKALKDFEVLLEKSTSKMTVENVQEIGWLP